jgi:hypothetical protein
MAVNGEMTFPNAAAALEGTRNFAHTGCCNNSPQRRIVALPPTNEFAVVAV